MVAGSDIFQASSVAKAVITVHDAVGAVILQVHVPVASAITNVGLQTTGLRFRIAPGSALHVTSVSSTSTGSIDGGLGADWSTLTGVGFDPPHVLGSTHITFKSSPSLGAGITGLHENAHVPVVVVVHTKALEFVTLNTCTVRPLASHVPATGSPSVGFTIGGLGFVPLAQDTTVLTGELTFSHGAIAVALTVSHAVSVAGSVHDHIHAALAVTGALEHDIAQRVVHELVRFITDPGSAVPVTTVSSSSTELIVGVSVELVLSYTVVFAGSLSFHASSVALASITSSVTGLGLGLQHVQLPATSATTGLGLHVIVDPVPLSVVRVIVADGSLVQVILVAPFSTG